MTTAVRQIKNGTITAALGAVTLPVDLGSQGALAVISGTWSATLQFEGLAADAATWISVPAFPVLGGTLVSSATANGNFLISGAGMLALRVRASAYSSGTVAVALSNAPVGGPSFPVPGAGTANTFPAATGSMGAAEAAVTVNPLMGATVAMVQLASVGSATFTFEGTANGSVWFSVPYTAVTGAVLGSLLTTATANGNYLVAVAGLLGFRVRCSTYASGTATCTIQTGIGNGLFPCPAILWGATGTHVDALSNTQTGFLASNGAGILVDALNYGHNGATNDKVRVTKVVTVVALGAGTTETTIWTPTSGKKFRLMGFVLTVGAASTLTFKDNTGGTTIAVARGTTDQPIWVNWGNGILSAAANNVLTVTRGTSATLDGTLFGTEE